MSQVAYYSANPWISHEFSIRFRKGIHFAWVSEYFDSETAPPGTAGAAVAPSSNPKTIFKQLWRDCDREDEHSALIAGYRKTFIRLSTIWLSDGIITSADRDEIIATVKSRSWKIWRPTLYVIPKSNIDVTRIKKVEQKKRAAYGPESQIADLRVGEFDLLEYL